MNILHSSPPSTPWQIERRRILQRICLNLKAAQKRGQPLYQTILRYSRYYHQRPYRCEPWRKLALAPGTLQQWWCHWNKAGQMAEVFQLKYPQRTPEKLIRFVEFCASQHAPSLKAAWLKFNTQQFAKRSPGLTLNQIKKYLRPSDLALLQKLQGDSAFDQSLRRQIIATVIQRALEPASASRQPKERRRA